MKKLTLICALLLAPPLLAQNGGPKPRSDIKWATGDNRALPVFYYSAQKNQFLDGGMKYMSPEKAMPIARFCDALWSTHYAEAVRDIIRDRRPQ